MKNKLQNLSSSSSNEMKKNHMKPFLIL